MTAFVTTPALPLDGIGGWRLAERTEDRLRDAFGRDPVLTRDLAHFRARIGSVSSAEELVADRQLLRVALGAFGLDDEVGKPAFVRRIVEEGASDPRAFANRLADSRWARFAAAFDLSTPLGAIRMGRDGFVEKIAAAHEARQFERALGESDPDLRLAFNFRREAARIAAEAPTDRAGWLTILGDRPVRAVLEGALGLPESFGTLDVDRQVDALSAAAARVLGDGSPGALSDPVAIDRVVTRYLARQTAEAGPSATTPGMAALMLLSGSARGLVLSNAV